MDSCWPKFFKKFIICMDEARGNEGGSGLGLAIADRIIKAHSGTLELLNRDEGGLEAKITIPLNFG